MTLTVKINERTENALEARCRREGQTKSAVIRRLIESYVADSPRLSPAAIYDEVTGGRAPSSDREAASRDHSRIIKTKLRARHDDR